MSDIESKLDEILYDHFCSIQAAGGHKHHQHSKDNAKQAIQQLINEAVREARIDELKMTVRLLKMYERGPIEGDIIDDRETRLTNLKV